METIPVIPWLSSHARHSDPTLVVMHATAGGSASGAIATLREKGFSYHYIIERDGRIFKCVPASHVAFHAGNSNGPHEAAAKVSRSQDRRANFRAGCTVNPYSIGISFVNLNDGSDPITGPQMMKAAELVRECVKMYPSLEHVTTHAIVSPRRKTDPKLFDLEAFAFHVGLEAWEFTP